HFLFNSLGAASELALRDPASAARVLRYLESMLRFAMDDSIELVTLGRELEALGPYLEIQRLRFADWITVENHASEDARDCLIPRFILQPLVENAIHHGLSGRSSPGTIRIHAAVRRGELE